MLSQGGSGLPCRKETHIDAPRHARQAAHQVPCLHALNEGKVDDADKRPEGPAGAHDAPELGAAPGQHGAPVDGAVVDGAAGGAVVCHGLLEPAHEDAEEQRVDGRAGRLVQQRLGQRVSDVEFRLVERLVGLGRGGGDEVGRERAFEEVLPVTGGLSVAGGVVGSCEFSQDHMATC